MNTKFPTLFAAVAAVGLLWCSSVAQAASLTGAVNTAPSTSADLTATGATNWAVWNYASTTTGAALAPSNTRSGGPNLASMPGNISGIGRVGSATNTTVRGGNASVVNFSYSNGNNPTTFGPAISGLVFPSALDAADQGVALKVTGDPTQVSQITVWASGLAGQGTMTASSTGVADVVLQSQTYTTTATAHGSKGATVFTYNFQPASVSDFLMLSYVLTTDTAGANNSHVGISAVAVTVPEPAAVFGAVAGLGMLAMSRRRRRS